MSLPADIHNTSLLPSLPDPDNEVRAQNVLFYLFRIREPSKCVTRNAVGNLVCYVQFYLQYYKPRKVHVSFIWGCIFVHVPSSNLHYIGGIEEEVDYQYVGEVQRCHYERELSKIKMKGLKLHFVKDETPLMAVLADEGPLYMCKDFKIFYRYNSITHDTAGVGRLVTMAGVS